MGKSSFTSEVKTSIPPPAAMAWWWDYAPGDHGDARFAKIWGQQKPGDGRTIVSKTKDQVVMKDTMGGRPMQFTAKAHGKDTLTIDGIGPSWTSHGTLRFVPDGKGTKIVNTIEVEGGVIMGLMMSLMGFGKKLNQDVETHLALMEEDWKKKPW